VHARAISIEDAGDADFKLVLPEIVEEQRLGAALAFIITGPWPNRIDIAAIAFGLWVYIRVAIDLRRPERFWL
jgi:hypothetical protein